MVDDKDVADRPDVTPTVEEASKNRLAKNYQQLTPLANLLAGNLVQQNRDSKAQIDSRRGLAATQLVQQVSYSLPRHPPYFLFEYLSGVCAFVSKYFSIFDRLEHE